MHIALTIPHFRATTGGAEGFAVTVATALAQRGHRVDVFAETAGRAEGVTIQEMPLRNAAAVIADSAPDVSIDWGLNTTADIHRLGGGTHREFMRYNLDWRRGAARVLKRLEYLLAAKHRRLVRREARLLQSTGTHFLAVSNFVADQLRRTAPLVGDDRIHILHNGVDTARFSPERTDADRDAVRAKLGLPADAAVFLFVGHNLALKNVALMMRVFAEIAALHPHVRLLVMGKRCPRPRPHWLVCAGHQADPLAGYAAADALVHPTFYDACANVVLEAMACGRPVISSDLNGSAELVRPGTDGFVLPVLGREGVAANWQTAITELAVDHDRRQALGRAARENAEQHSISWYVRELEEVLQNVADTRQKGGSPLRG